MFYIRTYVPVKPLRLRYHLGVAVTVEDVRALALALPRSYEALVRGRIKFRVGRIVYLTFSRDETLLGFAFPKEEREALIETWPHKFMQPKPADRRYNWVVGRLAEIDGEELEELVFDAWRFAVPKRLAALPDEQLRDHVQGASVVHE